MTAGDRAGSSRPAQSRPSPAALLPQPAEAAAAVARLAAPLT